MKLRIDKDGDALYLKLTDSKIRDSGEVAPGIILDYDENDTVVGIEVLFLRTRTSPTDSLDVPVEYL